MENKKKTRSPLTGILIALMFCSSWAILGIVLALSSASVNLGGSIRFTATDIYADVTGTVTGTATPNTLEDIHFSASTKSFTTPTSWSNMTLDFQKNVNIVVTINVTNKSPERSLWITFTDNITSTNTDITRELGGNPISVLNVVEVLKSETKSFKITLHVTDQNSSVSGKFELGMHLDNTAPKANQSDIQYTITNGKAVVSGYTGSLTTFSIPETIDGYPTALNPSSSDSISGVSLPSTVVNVVIPGTINTIPKRAFKDNTILKSVTFGEGIKTIEPYAFYGCTGLEDVVLPNSLTTINGSGFGFCSGLKNLYLGTSLKEIGDMAFCGSASSNAPKITTLSIPGSVEKIGALAFQSCGSLETLTLNNGIKEIHRKAFAYCGNITEINLPDSIKYIGDYAFQACKINSTPQEIRLPDNIEQIGGPTYFKLDINNTSYNTQEKVDEARRNVVGDNSFYNCSIKEFAISSENKYYTAVDGVLYVKGVNGEPTILVAYPKQKIQTDKVYRMPNTVKNGYAHAIIGVYNVHTVVLSDAFEIKETTYSTSQYTETGRWSNNLNALWGRFGNFVLECNTTNTKYYSENGAIYGKDGTTYANTLFYMPIYTSSANQTFAVKDGTTTIFNGAIPINTASSMSWPRGTLYRYATVSIPASVTAIGEKSINVLNGGSFYGETSQYSVEIDPANAVYTVTDGKITTK